MLTCSGVLPAESREDKFAPRSIKSFIISGFTLFLQARWHAGNGSYRSQFLIVFLTNSPVIPSSSFASRFLSGVFIISFTTSRLFAVVARCNKFFLPCFRVSTGGGCFLTKFFSFVQRFVAVLLEISMRTAIECVISNLPVISVELNEIIEAVVNWKLPVDWEESVFTVLMDLIVPELFIMVNW